MRRIGEDDYEVRWTDGGDAHQIYHLKLLKPREVAVPMEHRLPVFKENFLMCFCL